MNLFRFLLDPLYFMRTSKKLLQAQCETYLGWIDRNNQLSSGYKYWLDAFIKDTKKTDVLDINLEDVDFFVKNRQDIVRTLGSEMMCRKAITGIIRFYMARSKNGKTKAIGRPPALSQYQRIGELKEKLGDAITFKEIGILINPDKPVDKGNVYRWYHRFLALKKGG